MYSKENNEGCYGVYPFSGIPTFLRAKELRTKEEFESANFDIGILGIPFDEGMPFIPGTRFGPRAIREQTLRYNKRGYYSVDEDKIFLSREFGEERLADLGDVAITPTDIEGSLTQITDSVRTILLKKKDGCSPLLISLGGDHSVSNPVIRGFDALGEAFHVVQFDAHPDYAKAEPGFSYTNAHPFRHVAGMSHVKSLTQVGIRSVRAFQARDSRADGNQVIGMKRFYELGPKGIAALIPAGEPCYVSIDIDALDCTLVPGCVSAEPNGMTFRELTDSLAALAKRCRIVGFDLVEVAPLLDTPNKITSYLATQLIIEFLGRICEEDYWKKRYL